MYPERQNTRFVLTRDKKVVLFTRRTALLLEAVYISSKDTSVSSKIALMCKISHRKANQNLNSYSGSFKVILVSVSRYPECHVVVMEKPTSGFVDFGIA